MMNMKRIEVVELYVKKRIEKLEQSQNEYKLNAAEITELKDVLDVIEQTQAKCINTYAVMEGEPRYKETACDHVYGR